MNAWVAGVAGLGGGAELPSPAPQNLRNTVVGGTPPKEGSVCYVNLLVLSLTSAVFLATSSLPFIPVKHDLKARISV